MTIEAPTRTPHPDDFIIVDLTLKFRAKLNPEEEDAPPVVSTNVGFWGQVGEAADYLERVLSAIRERRLYGFMAQDAAEGPVDAGQWIAMSNEELLTDGIAPTDI
jgi:hypothetical protein